MKLYRHCVVVAAGGLLLAAVGELLAGGIGSDPKWYHLPFVIPVAVASMLGKGGGDLNWIAGNLVWWLECLVFGLLLDGLFVAFVQRSRKDDVS